MKKRKQDRRPLFFHEKDFEKVYITKDIYFYLGVVPGFTKEDGVYDVLYSMDRKELIYGQEFNIIEKFENTVIVKFLKPIRYSKAGYNYDAYRFVSYNVEYGNVGFDVKTSDNYSFILRENGFKWMHDSIFVFEEIGKDTYEFIEFNDFVVLKDVEDYIVDYDKILVKFEEGQSIYAKGYSCDEYFDTIIKIPMYKDLLSNVYVMGKIVDDSTLVYKMLDIHGYEVKDLYFRRMKTYEGAVIVEEANKDGSIKNNFAIVHGMYASVTRLDPKYNTFSNIVDDRIFVAERIKNSDNYKFTLMDLKGKVIMELNELIENFLSMQYGEFELMLAVGYEDKGNLCSFFYFDKNGKRYPVIGNEKFERSGYKLNCFSHYYDFKTPLYVYNKDNW